MRISLIFILRRLLCLDLCFAWLLTLIFCLRFSDWLVILFDHCISLDFKRWLLWLRLLAIWLFDWLLNSCVLFFLLLVDLRLFLLVDLRLFLLVDLRLFFFLLVDLRHINMVCHRLFFRFTSAEINCRLLSAVYVDDFELDFAFEGPQHAIITYHIAFEYSFTFFKLVHVQLAVSKILNSD